MSLGREFERKLQNLREMDDIIDFSRATIQLDILIFLSTCNQATIDEMMRNLGYRRKAITDALRKMVNKGLVLKRVYHGKEVIVLDDMGRKYINTLTEILNGDSVRDLGDYLNFDKYSSLYNNLLAAYYVFEVLLYLGLSKGYEASLTTLSKVTGLSSGRLKSYLDIYIDNPDPRLRLFKRVYKPVVIAKAFKMFIDRRMNRKKLHYKLTKQGVKLLNRLPVYIKLQNNPARKLLLRVTKSHNLRVAFEKVLAVFIIGNLIPYLFLIANNSIYIALIWFYIFIVLAVMIILASM